MINCFQLSLSNSTCAASSWRAIHRRAHTARCDQRLAVAADVGAFVDAAGALWTWAGAYTRSLISSTQDVLVTPPHVPQSNRLGRNHAPNISDKMRLR
jgi:hypothetical protein